jgi:DNA modification methylase
MPGKDSRRREALTQARTRAPIRTWGEPEVARALGRALEVGEGGGLTHGFHTYPARMHPETARRALAALGVGPGRLVVDPFCGSGTVLVEAVRAGAPAVGVDASPLAVLVARAKVWDAPASRRQELVLRARDIAARVIEEGKAARRKQRQTPVVKSPPSGGHSAAAGGRAAAAGGRAAAAGGRAAAAGGRAAAGGGSFDWGAWFEPHVRREVTSLRDRLSDLPDELRDPLRAVLSSVLVKVSRRASDTRSETVERAIGRGMPARLFAARAEELARGLDALWRAAPRGTPAPRVLLGDARALPLGDGEAHAILTSPPYAGTYDYLENQRMRLAFLGLPEDPLAGAEIGARRGFSGGPVEVAAAIAAWEGDFLRALVEIARVLAPGRSAALLVGDSIAGALTSTSASRPRAVRADAAVARLAPRAGLTVVAVASMARAALGAVERDAFRAAGAAKSEHLIVLARGASA